MKSERPAGGRTLAAVLLAAVIVVGGVFIAAKLGGSRAVEIELTTGPAIQGTVYVGGQVSDPGYYPYRPGDSVEDVLAAAGGPTDNASDLQLLALPAGASGAPQKVDINRAGAWLLEALPGVGETRAQAIIAYREQHGPFRDIHELTNVPGFGEATFEAIKDLIAVAEE